MISSISGSSNVYRSMDWQPAKPDPEKMFKQADTSGDGTLDKAELSTFIQGMPKMEGDDSSGIDVDEAFTLSDTDEDGVLTQEEFAAGGEKMRDKMGKGKPPMEGMTQGLGQSSQNYTQSLLDMLSTMESSEESTSASSSTDSQSLLQYIKSYLSQSTSNTNLQLTGSYSLNITG